MRSSPSVARILFAVVASSLVLPTLAITTARVLPGNNLWWVILRALTPMAIVPYAFAVIILAAMSHGLRGGARGITVSALVVVTSLLLLHVWWLGKPFLAHGSGSATEERFVVVTANLHIGRANVNTLLDTVERDHVDVLVLEEITPSALAELDKGGLDRRLPHRAGAPKPNRDGIMLFANWPLRDLKEIKTSTPGFSVEATTRTGLMRILAVHPMAPNNGVAQWSRDLDLVVATAKASPAPTVIAGDFNATLDHPQLQTLMNLNYRDADSDAGLGWRPTWPSLGSVRLATVGLPPLFALDHIFIRGPLECTDAHTLVIPGSDHRALVTNLAWTKSLDHATGQLPAP